ncbi:GHMP kinase [Aquabacter sp. L1I39]|uniref:beta-ribofuranosylaminobenzene 5'-phosphate synthase family protein n=1 Tax=Aquabacter sp. L1I39 TaxID=2820278 RepID=UPI001ADBCCD2|nr:beta-ribofuranosylaminobenzene 5'-phosphate synthase family protein [Aquabacter sp. L1I39]QTL03693.1 GHMP kinase [Aquabacter sp. L1I39]
MRVTAPARLHLGFLDLGGSLGRRFGSLGLTLERPVTTVHLAPAEMDSLAGPDSARAGRARDAVRAAAGGRQPLAITVETALPTHNGLGSGTQLALAVAAGMSRLAGRPDDPRALAGALGRGQRSAIGLAAFMAGGVVLDGGKALAGDADAPPPVIARLPVPQDWRILLVTDTARAGLSGEAETHAMGRLPPFPETLAAHLCHLALMRALPSLAEGHAEGFGAAVGEIQRHLGDHYAAAQGGGRYSSPDVTEVMEFLATQGVAGIGQSSWGPTGFAILGSPDEAEALSSRLRSRYAEKANLGFDCVRGNNRGAEVVDL